MRCSHESSKQAGIDVILVGDSLGVVVQGKANTLSVTMEEMLYHTKLVAGAAQQSLVIGDMPFMSYQASVDDALRNAGRFLQAGATAVKLEGGAAMADRVAAVTRIGIPVVGHLGMTPQSVHQYGGFKVQGKDKDQAQQILKDAQALEAAGAVAIVLEAIPTGLAKSVTGPVANSNHRYRCGASLRWPSAGAVRCAGTLRRVHPKVREAVCPPQSRCCGSPPSL